VSSANTVEPIEMPLGEDMRGHPQLKYIAYVRLHLFRNLKVHAVILIAAAKVKDVSRSRTVTYAVKNGRLIFRKRYKIVTFIQHAN